MAKLIIGMHSESRARMLFLFELGGPITDSAARAVVPAWDASAVSTEFEVPPVWVQAINEGRAGYLVCSLERRSGETDEAFAKATWVEYDARTVAEIERRQAEVLKLGRYDPKRFTLES